MGEVIPMGNRHLHTRLHQVSQEIDRLWSEIEEKERERESIQRKLGLLAVENGLEG